jgi:HemY protein
VRTLLWGIAIAALAVGLTLAASHNTGYVLLVLPPYRVELSLNLLLVLLALGFAVGYALVRAVSAMLRLPRQVREYRVARRREKARATLLEALREYFAGRYGRAEKAAAASVELREQASWPRCSRPARRTNCAHTSGGTPILSRRLPPRRASRRGW